MSRTKRRIGRVIGIALVTLAVVLLLVALRLGTLIRTAVNTMGPPLLGVPVSVESVAVHPLQGRFNLRALTIGNPEGYSSEYLFRLDEMRLQLAVADLFKGQTRFKEIVIEGPHVWYDRKLTRSNVGDLLEHLEKMAPAEQPADKPRDSKPAKPVIIDHFEMKEGTVGLKVGVGMKLPLPGIELKDLGRDGALMPVQIIRLVFVNIFKGVLNVVAGAGDLAVEGLKGAGSLAADGIKGAGDLASDGIKGAGKAVGGLVSGIGGRLLGGSGATNAAAADD